VQLTIRVMLQVPLGYQSFLMQQWLGSRLGVHFAMILSLIN
jgi:hypothetical protein